MPDEFQFDVFLSHSAKDKAVVRPLADGIFNNSQHSTSNSQLPPGSDWAQLESGMFRTGQRPFRDPLNKERRFVPLRLDDAPIKGSLAQFLEVNLLPELREKESVFRKDQQQSPPNK